MEHDVISSLVAPPSHHLVPGAATAFGDRPLNVLFRHLDRAALAVHAVLSINHKLLLAALLVVVIPASEKEGKGDRPSRCRTSEYVPGRSGGEGRP